MRNNEFENYYEMLGVAREATNYEIRRAYFQRSLQYHPDKNISTDEEWQKAHQGFLKIHHAYSVLGDEILREKYNLFYDIEVDSMSSRELRLQELQRKVAEEEAQIAELKKSGAKLCAEIDKILGNRNNFFATLNEVKQNKPSFENFSEDLGDANPTQFL